MSYSDFLYFAPLLLATIIMFLLWRIESEVRPLVAGVVKGLTTDATSNAKLYAYGFLLALTASLQALGTEAAKYEWRLLGSFCAVAQPACVAVIGFISQLKAKPEKTGTTAPFSTT